MLPRNLGQNDKTHQTIWEELGEGAPTIIGFANLCSLAMCDDKMPPVSARGELISDHARALLAMAAVRGVFEIRNNREGFDSTERFLAVCVEEETDVWQLFRQKNDPETTVQFLEGFRQLCRFGLTIHHLQREFSLTAAGFEVARTIDKIEYSSFLDFAQQVQL